MKSFEQFSINCKNFNDKQMTVVKKYYEIYKNKCFDKWLSNIPADEINKVGLEIMRKIWEAMNVDDR